MNRLFSGLLVLVFAAGLAACDASRTEIVEPPMPGTGDPDVTVAGSVRALPGGFQCADESRCFTGDAEAACRDVLWRPRNQATGIELNSRVATPGGTIQYSGVPSGTYVVRQIVSHPSGYSEQETHQVVVE